MSKIFGKIKIEMHKTLTILFLLFLFNCLVGAGGRGIASDNDGHAGAAVTVIRGLEGAKALKDGTESIVSMAQEGVTLNNAGKLAGAAVIEAVTTHAIQQGLSGKYGVTIFVRGISVTVRGSIVNGVLHIGSFWIQ